MCRAGTMLALLTLFSAEGAENIALGRPYSFSAPSNYALCTDAGDGTNLTDGVYAKDVLWMQKEAVGWSCGFGDGEERVVTVDLGHDEPISGFSWNLAAGSAGVPWPELIFVYVSGDAKEWRFVGDLYAASKKENGAPAEDGYGTYRARSLRMKCRGRYVAFLVRTHAYAFVDEVEVYRGGTECRLAASGMVVKDVVAHSRLVRMRRADKAELDEIASTAAAADDATWVDALRRARLVNARLARTRGFTKPFMWSAPRWDNVKMTDIVPPGGRDAGLSVRMMRGETRAAAANLSNPTERDMRFDVRAEGMPECANVELREVLFTCAKSGRRTASALRPGEGAAISVDVPAGTVKQVWVSFVRPASPAGTFRGNLVATAGASSMSIPLELTLSRISFPARPHLHVGGWDYVDSGNTRFRAPGNLAGKMREMKAMFTDAPWATGGVAPRGAKFGPDGALLDAGVLDFAAWDEWVSLWDKDARMFCVFLGWKDFHGEKVGTARFTRMVGDYVRAWYEHAAANGLNGRPAYMLPLDEPRTDEQDALFVAWARAIKSGGGFRIFVDPCRPDARKTASDVYDVADVVCPASKHVWQGRSADFHRRLVAAGKEVWLYSCSGPVRTFDPVAYYRAQAWRAWGIGATGTFFWAFGDGGGIGDSWRPLEQPGTDYSPFFVSPDDAMASKHSMAIMESVEDYEYLAMLAEKIAAMRKEGRATADLERLLAEAPERVTGDVACPSNGHEIVDPRYDWDHPNRRGAADEVRMELLDALERP